MSAQPATAPVTKAATGYSDGIPLPIVSHDNVAVEAIVIAPVVATPAPAHAITLSPTEITEIVREIETLTAAINKAREHYDKREETLATLTTLKHRRDEITRELDDKMTRINELRDQVADLQTAADVLTTEQDDVETKYDTTIAATGLKGDLEPQTVIDRLHERIVTNVASLRRCTERLTIGMALATANTADATTATVDPYAVEREEIARRERELAAEKEALAQREEIARCERELAASLSALAQREGDREAAADRAAAANEIVMTPLNPDGTVNVATCCGIVLKVMPGGKDANGNVRFIPPGQCVCATCFKQWRAAGYAS